MSRSSSGFTLLEALIALALALVVVSAVVVMAAGTDRLSRSQGLLADAQQRARVIAETLGRDLRLAGAGVDRGPMTGPLAHAFSPLWPRRVGGDRPDGVFIARNDAIALVYVPDTVVQTTLAAGGSGRDGRLTIAPCAGQAACRMTAGSTLALFDGAGRLELLSVPAAATGNPPVRSLAGGSGVFDAGATVAEVVIREYYFDPQASKVRYFDGDRTDQPVVDDVTALSFAYFGDAAPPRWPRPPEGVPNCLYDASGNWRGGVTLQADSDGLARVPAIMLTDGPWCGDGSTAFDADLLRVRRIRVEVRLRVGGPATDHPDYQVVFDVAPPNFGFGAQPGE